MLLWRCIDNNSYQGCSPPERQEFFDEEPAQEYGSNGYEENYGSSGDAGWDECAQTEFPKPTGSDNNEIPNPTGWGNESFPTEVSEPTGWGNESIPTEVTEPACRGEEHLEAELPNSITDEAEWSDGRK